MLKITPNSAKNFTVFKVLLFYLLFPKSRTSTVFNNKTFIYSTNASEKSEGYLLKIILEFPKIEKKKRKILSIVGGFVQIL